MFLLFFSFANAEVPEAASIDVSAIGAATDTCLAAVRADFDAGAVLPSRAEQASISAELCSKDPALASASMGRARDATLEEYRAARARIDAAAAAKASRRPALSGRVTVEDDWISSSLDRARTSQAQESESPDAALALGAWADVERMNGQITVLDAAIKRVSTAVHQYLALRDGLWMMDCTGEISLDYPESMPVDARYTHEEQCAQLTLRRNGVHGTEAVTRNPGAARR